MSDTDVHSDSLYTYFYLNRVFNGLEYSKMLGEMNMNEERTNHKQN